MKMNPRTGGRGACGRLLRERPRRRARAKLAETRATNQAAPPAVLSDSRAARSCSPDSTPGGSSLAARPDVVGPERAEVADVESAPGDDRVAEGHLRELPDLFVPGPGG